MSLTGIGVYTGKQFLDELYVRIKRGAIQVVLEGQADTHCRVQIAGLGRDGKWGFTVAAFPPKVEHSNG